MEVFILIGLVLSLSVAVVWLLMWGSDWEKEVLYTADLLDYSIDEERDLDLKVETLTEELVDVRALATYWEGEADSLLKKLDETRAKASKVAFEAFDAKQSNALLRRENEDLRRFLEKSQDETRYWKESWEMVSVMHGEDMGRVTRAVLSLNDVANWLGETCGQKPLKDEPTKNA